jgi:hypothetical protein
MRGLKERISIRKGSKKKAAAATKTPAAADGGSSSKKSKSSAAAASEKAVAALDADAPCNASSVGELKESQYVDDGGGGADSDGVRSTTCQVLDRCFSPT